MKGKQFFSQKKSQLLLQSLLGLVFLAFWWRFFDFDFFATTIKKAELRLILLSGIIYLMASLLRGVRFKLLLDLLINLPVLKVFALNNIGTLINFMVPLRAGEIVKPVLLKKFHPQLSGSKVFSVVTVDKLGDLFSMFFLVLLLTPFVLGMVGSFKLILIAGLLFIIVAVGLLALIWQGGRITQLIERLMKLPGFKLIPGRLWQYLCNFITGFELFKNRELLLVAAFFFSLLETGLDGISFYYLFQAFGFEAFLSGAILALTLIYFSFLIPSAPGYLGTLEVVGIVVLVLGFGVEESQAAAVLAFYHLFSILLISLAAAWAVAYLKLGSLLRLMTTTDFNLKSCREK